MCKNKISIDKETRISKKNIELFLNTKQEVSCNFCSKAFETKRDMMTNKKNEHGK